MTAQRIARVIARLNVGGPARHVIWLTEALDRGAYRTMLITGTVAAGEEEMTDFAAAHAVRPVVIPEMSRELSWRDASTILKLHRLFRRFKPHFVHTHTAKAGAAGRVAAFAYRWLTPGVLLGRPRRCAVIHTYHGHVFHGYYGRLRTSLFLAIERALAHLTDRILVLSPQQLEEIHGVFRIGRREQFRIVPLGMDFDEVRTDAASGRALRERLGIPPQARLIAIVGRLVPIKNHDLLIAAASQLLAHRSDATFVAFGDGTERRRLEALVAAQGISERFLFAGTASPGEIYGAADAVALTSRNEGTPLSLIEAMANSLPVVSTAVGGVADLFGAVREFRDGYEVRERGLTVSDDAVALAAALERILSDRPLVAETTGRAQQYVLAAHSKDRLVADILAVLRELDPPNDDRTEKEPGPD